MTAREAIECYDLLKLEHWSSIGALKKKHREIQNEFHPDKHHASPKKRAEGEEKLKRINPIYQKFIRYLDSSPHALQQLKNSAENARSKVADENAAAKAAAAKKWRDHCEPIRKEEEQKRSEQELRNKEKDKKAAEEAREKEKEEAKQRRIEKIKKAADLGMSEAQYEMGNIYGAGRFVKKDEKEQAKWYRRAAEQGHLKAQEDLAFLYEWGKGVGKNEEEAANWYQKAASQGSEKAQEYLGFLYAKGFGVPQNFELAAHWYKQAAQQGNVEAQRELSEMYARGKGVPQDLTKAEMWKKEGNKKK